jgi:tetratricopeptide (TPR) repeat protein
MGLQQALPLAQPTPVLLHQLGCALYSKARFAHALEKYWQGWSFLHQSAGNNDQRADFYNSAGKCFNDVYQFAMALELFERARRIRVTLRQNDKQACTSGAMGEAYWRVGDVDNAERCYLKNVELSQQVGRARNDRHDEMRATNFLAHVLFAKGDFDGAEPLYRQTEKYYGERYDSNPRMLPCYRLPCWPISTHCACGVRAITRQQQYASKKQKRYCKHCIRRNGQWC